MAKRLRLFDKQGNPVVFDIGAASVTIDAEGKSLDVKLSELMDAIASAVKSVTFNGQVKDIDAHGNVNLGQQLNPNWNESNPSHPSFIENKPDVVNDLQLEQSTKVLKKTRNGVVPEVLTVPSRTSQLQNDSGYITIDDVPEPGATIVPDTSMSDTSENMVQNKVIKAYVDNLINGLLDGAPEALNTLKELSAALGNNADFAATITQQLSQLQPRLNAGTGIAINGSQISVETGEVAANEDKPVSGGDVKVELDLKQELLQFDTAPTASSTRMVTSGAVKAALDALLASTFSINADGEWCINGVTTGQSAVGPAGSTVVVGDEYEFEVVNDLTTGGIAKALSAAMGLTLRYNVNRIHAKLNELILALAGNAFRSNAVAQLPALDWEQNTITIALSSGTNKLSLTGTLVTGTFTGVLSVEQGYTNTHGLPFVGDVSAVMLGQPKVVTYDETTGAITIEDISADVEITAIATEIHGVDGSNNPVRWRMGKYFSNDSSKTPSQIVQTSADGAFSDYIPVSFVAGDVLEFDLGKYCFVANDYTTNPYIEFYGSDKSYIAHIGMNSENARSWPVPSGHDVLNTAYIRVSAYVPRIGAVYVKKNNSYYLKGDGIA